MDDAENPDESEARPSSGRTTDRITRLRSCRCACCPLHCPCSYDPWAYDAAAMAEERAEADTEFGARLKAARDAATLSTTQTPEDLFLSRESVDR